MADDKKVPDVPELPDAVSDFVNARARGTETGPVTIDNLFRGSSLDSMRGELKDRGFSFYKDSEGKDRFLAVDADEDGNIFNIAAAIPRTTGRAEEFLKQIDDFKEQLSTGEQTRKDRIALFRRVYRAEGEVNNAVNKQAALVATDGSFKVRSVKGQRGKSGDKKAEELLKILEYWKENVNASTEEAVMKGDRGVSAFIAQGVRLALTEGDHVARTHWVDIDVPDVGRFSLPMNLQTFSTQYIEIPEGLEGTGIELMYWVPPRSFVQTLQNPKDPNVKEYIERLMDSEVLNAIRKDGRYLLTPDLMMHIRNRGTGTENFGESVIEPAMSDIRYKRSLDALELVTIENLINRLVIVMVGSDNADSVYHKQEVSARRLQLLQRMFQRIGPSATILWAGPDIEIKEVGAYDAILDLDGRYGIAQNRIRSALGVPSALLTGEATDGKAAGWAAAIGVAAQLRELQNQYAQWLRTVAERIAIENGFEQVNVIWDFHNNLLIDKAAAAEVIMKAFMSGLISIQTAVEELGYSFEAEETRQADEVSRGYKEEPFGAPKSQQTTNPTGAGGEDGGRPTKEENPEPDPRDNQETKTPEENK